MLACKEAEAESFKQEILKKSPNTGELCQA